MAVAEARSFKLEASVPTGLELGAAEECAEALGAAPESSRGRLAFTVHSLRDLEKVSRVC